MVELNNNIDFKTRRGLFTAPSTYSYQTVENANLNNLGTTFTDILNAALTRTLGTSSPQYTLLQTGLTSSTAAYPAHGENIETSTPSPTILQFQLLSAQYLESGGSNLIIEYFNLTSASATIQEVGDTESLHSNRGYEVGIIYMDDFNRSSTALVSENNTVNIPCSASTTKNKIKVNIPISQRAPSWATRYKFCIKPDRDTYNTVYSSIFFEDPNSNNAYLLLEGENAKSRRGR